MKSAAGCATERGVAASIRATIAESNMEAVPLERAPRVAVYTPPNSTPWDDAVTMALHGRHPAAIA